MSQKAMEDDQTFSRGVKGHVVSMQSKGWHYNQRPVHSVAVCECGWTNTVPWCEHEAQDRAIATHWESVNKRTN